MKCPWENGIWIKVEGDTFRNCLDYITRYRRAMNRFDWKTIDMPRNPDGKISIQKELRGTLAEFLVVQTLKEVTRTWAWVILDKAENDRRPDAKFLLDGLEIVYRDCFTCTMPYNNECWVEQDWYDRNKDKFLKKEPPSINIMFVFYCNWKKQFVVVGYFPLKDVPSLPLKTDRVKKTGKPYKPHYVVAAEKLIRSNLST